MMRKVYLNSTGSSVQPRTHRRADRNIQIFKLARMSLFLFIAIGYRLVAADATSTTAATSERAILLKDGSVYRGEVSILAPNERIVLKLANGEIREILWQDIHELTKPIIDTNSENTVRFALEQELSLSSGDLVRGQIVVFRPNISITLKIANGTVREIDWADVQTSKSAIRSSTNAERAVVMLDGSIFRGEVSELIIGQDFTMAIPTGERKRVIWTAIKKVTSPLQSTANVSGEFVAVRTIIFEDGTQVTGQLIEYLPQTRIVLRLPDSSIRWIKWNEFRQVLTAPEALSAAGSTPSSMSVTVGDTREERHDEVYVVIQSNNPAAQLYRFFDVEKEKHCWVAPVKGMINTVCTETKIRNFRTACSVPCNRRLSGGRYRIEGYGVVTSDEFELNGYSGRTVSLQIRAGSTNRRVAGGVLITIGAIVSVTGLIVGLLSGAERTDNLAADKMRNATLTRVGWPLFGGGFVSIGVGTALMLTASTRVDLSYQNIP